MDKPRLTSKSRFNVCKYGNLHQWLLIQEPIGIFFFPIRNLNLVCTKPQCLLKQTKCNQENLCIISKAVHKKGCYLKKQAKTKESINILKKNKDTIK